jgi:hypothetical protein
VRKRLRVLWDADTTRARASGEARARRVDERWDDAGCLV